MSTHTDSHCKKPSVKFKRLGTVWRCDCGQYWYATKVSQYDFRTPSRHKQWVNCTAHWTDKKHNDLQQQFYGYQRIVDSLRRDYDKWTPKVIDSFDSVSRDMTNLIERVTALEEKKVTRGKSASK